MTFHNPKKYSINLWGHQTSITLEPDFWLILQKLARQEKSSIKKIVESIDEIRTQEKDPVNLSSCLRVWVLRKLLEQ